MGAEDAAIVRQLRQRGGVLLGKTHTTAFAYITPTPTRNPRNDHGQDARVIRTAAKLERLLAAKP